MIYAPLPARGGRKADEALGFGSLSFEDNRVQAGESRPRAFSLASPFCVWTTATQSIPCRVKRVGSFGEMRSLDRGPVQGAEGSQGAAL